MINSQSNTDAYRIGFSMPTGTVVLFSSNAILNGWLLCNGSAISRSTYAALFRIIGTLYGPGDHINTFNLPDFRGRFALGLNDQQKQQGNFPSGGVSNVTLTQAELPAHSHESGLLSTVTAGGHSHSYSDPGHNHGGKTGDSNLSKGPYHLASKGGGGADDFGIHSHAINTDTTHITILESGNHSHSISGTTASQGEGKSFPIVNPYQTMNYIIYSGSS